MPSQRTEPSLDNAYARVRRAKQHITRLKREVRALHSQGEYAVSILPGTSGRFSDAR
jgi:hypothetical protein